MEGRVREKTLTGMFLKYIVIFLHQYRIDIYRRIYRTCTPVNDRSGTSGELCGTMA